MKAIFGLVSLVAVLAVVAVLVKKNVHSSQESLTRQAPSLSSGHNHPPEPMTVPQQSQQVQQQYRQQLESALNARRPDPDQAQ